MVSVYLRILLGALRAPNQFFAFTWVVASASKMNVSMSASGPGLAMTTLRLGLCFSFGLLGCRRLHGAT
jgi:hypothetical protein